MNILRYRQAVKTMDFDSIIAGSNPATEANFIPLYNLGSIPKLSFAEYDESVLALLSSVKPS